MKRYFLCMFAVLASVVGYAANYSVTVTTQRQIEYRDKNGNLVATDKEVGNSMTFQIVADTPRQAEDAALGQCQGACDSGTFVKVAENVNQKGKVCDKYVRTVPWEAKATLK